MRTILITGGCGFIGSNLAVALAAEGHNVTCFDNLSRRGSEVLLTRIQSAGCRFAHGDIRNIEDLQRVAGDFDLMIECSAEPSVLVGTQGADATFMVNNNLVGSLNCFEVASYRGEVFNVGGSVFSNLSLLETTALCHEVTGNIVNIVPSMVDRPADLIWYLTDNGNTQTTFDWKPEHSARDLLADTYTWLHENEQTFVDVLKG